MFITLSILKSFMSLMLWVIRSMDLSLKFSSIFFIISSLFSSSSPWIGSSKINKSPPKKIPLARETLLFIPPERDDTFLLKSSIPSSFKMSINYSSSSSLIIFKLSSGDNSSMSLFS